MRKHGPDKLKPLFVSLFLCCNLSNVFAEKHPAGFTSITQDTYDSRVKHANIDIKNFIKHSTLNITSQHYLQQLITDTQAYWQNRPYALKHAMGEGNWCDFKLTKTPCPHIQQDPIYRTDEFNCTTYTQTVLALIRATTLNQFKINLARIAYGANDTKTISYFNRNHFTSSDFNRINESTHLIKDVTPDIDKNKTRWKTTTINHQQWIQTQIKQSRSTLVRVLNAKQGESMLNKLHDNIKNAPATRQVKISYIPKEDLSITTKQGYKANEALLKAIPTPAIMEVVRDDTKWNVAGSSIKKVIGSGILVSHIGVLYRQGFKKGDLIYRNISCTDRNNPQCQVNPVYCNKVDGCNELMFSSATDAFPNQYYYYKDAKGHYQCTDKPPLHKIRTTTCNRVESLPLSQYVTTKQYGHYTFLDSPSIVGIHIEKIRNT